MVELIVLFFAMPTVFYLGRFRVPAIPALWVMLAYCLWVMRREGKLNLAALVPAGLEPRLASIAAVFISFVLLTTYLVYRYVPQDLFHFARTRPALWGVVMIAYPLLSVYPQGIIYRAFFFERYRTLFPSTWLMVLMSAVAFAYVHIVFRNWIALLATSVGGLLFAIRYAETGSLFVSSFEHALYGCWLFTVGLGQWFFYGATLRR